MSQKNVDLVLSGLPVFEAGDYEAMTQLWHPGGRVTAPAGWPEPGPFEGRDAVIAQFRRLVSDVGEHHFKEVEVLADHDDWVVLSFIWEIRGAESGASIASKITGAYRVEQGKVIEAHFRWTPEEALEAAGLTSPS
jgi:ketosteroid isomerase-like protein